MDAIIGVFLVIIAYLVMMLAIGFIYSKGNNDSSDFYLGGRKLGPFVTAMSAEASDMSSWLLMGLPGVAYLSGICDASWTAIGLAIGTYLNWLIVRNASGDTAQRRIRSHCRISLQTGIAMIRNCYWEFPQFLLLSFLSRIQRPDSRHVENCSPHYSEFRIWRLC